MSKKKLAAFALGAMILTPAAADAAVYVFTVSCGGKKVVEQWTTDGVDPGREALRTKTLEKHPDCSVGDYKAATDNQLLKNTQFYSEKKESPESGLPVVGPVVGGAKNAFCGLFSC